MRLSQFIAALQSVQKHLTDDPIVYLSNPGGNEDEPVKNAVFKYSRYERENILMIHATVVDDFFIDKTQSRSTCDK